MIEMKKQNEEKMYDKGCEVKIIRCQHSQQIIHLIFNEATSNSLILRLLFCVYVCVMKNTLTSDTCLQS